MRAEVAKYDWNAHLIGAIAEAENRSCDPSRHNLTGSEDHGVCVGSYGALQVGCLHYRDGEDRNDLATNVRVAYRVWQMQGYEAWTQYKNGEYKKFL